jgi:HK97 family phage prohead protease
MSTTENAGTGTAHTTEAEPQEQRGDPPPRDSLVRATQPFELVRADGEALPTLHGRGAVYGEWTEINSRMEGHFMERFAPGAFAKTIREQRDKIRCLFNHGQDPSIGMKPLGPITDLSERADGVHYEVQLLDTDYNRSLIPGLQAGLYGSSFRFGIVGKQDERKRVSNPHGILERTITEAYMRELGPTPFPAYDSTTAGIRSLTDEFVLGRFPTEQLLQETSLRADRDLVDEMRELARQFIASGDTDADAMNGILDLLAELHQRTTSDDENGTPDPARSTDAASEGTSRPSAATNPVPLWGMSDEEAPTWRL